jgi:hypothetical protein
VGSTAQHLRAEHTAQRSTAATYEPAVM